MEHVNTRTTPEAVSRLDLDEAWQLLTNEERAEGFRLLSPEDAEQLFMELDACSQAGLLLALSPPERKLWFRALAPDDAADVIQCVPHETHAELLDLLDAASRAQVSALLAHAEDVAGGLMNPMFARVRPDMRVDQAISYLRRQARERTETIHDAYVLDQQQRLLGVVSFRDLFLAAPDKRVQDIMETDVVTVPEEMDQESVGQLFGKHRLMAIPVIDHEGHMKGIITIDDIMDVVQEEATEDIHKIGGMEALEQPYLQASFWTMVRKRAGWLALLFLGEMLTASAMSGYEHEIAQAVVLALFVPLIISSGGNSGSQASTLVVRALALRHLRIADWWRVVHRELRAGVCLGAVLSLIGLARIIVWEAVFHTYGEHYLLVGFTVASSLLGVVTFGTLTGAMLPLILSKLGLDPASASAPFVATLVDVTGIVIYFTAARAFLGGALL